MGHRFVARTWSRVVDDRPDWPSGRCRRHCPNVWCECSSLNSHCSKVRGSAGLGTGFAHTSTRPSVRTRRGSHLARSGHLGTERREVTWFRSFQNDPRSLCNDPGLNHSGPSRRQLPLPLGVAAGRSQPSLRFAPLRLRQLPCARVTSELASLRHESPQLPQVCDRELGKAGI